MSLCPYISTLCFFPYYVYYVYYGYYAFSRHPHLCDSKRNVKALEHRRIFSHNLHNALFYVLFNAIFCVCHNYLNVRICICTLWLDEKNFGNHVQEPEIPDFRCKIIEKIWKLEEIM